MPQPHTCLATPLLVDNEGNKDRTDRAFSLTGPTRREKYLGPVLTAATLLVLQHNH